MPGATYIRSLPQSQEQQLIHTERGFRRYLQTADREVLLVIVRSLSRELCARRLAGCWLVMEAHARLQKSIDLEQESGREVRR